MSRFRGPVVTGLLLFTALAMAHGGETESGKMDMASMNTTKEIDPNDPYYLPSYAGLKEHTGWLLAHVVLMTLAWFFILPIGIMFSIARSRLALPVQFLFLVLNGVGVGVSVIYNVNTPDLYENNAHHPVGWVATWVVTAQFIMSLLFVYAGRSEKTMPKASERAAFLPISIANMAQHSMTPYSDYRWSGDSGQGTERSSSHDSGLVSPSDPESRLPFHKREAQAEDEDDEDQEGPTLPLPHKPSFFRNSGVDKFLSKRVPGLISSKLLKILEIVHVVIDRTILVLGFIAICTGGITYAGIFRGRGVFSGLAHWIKGGIFFWYGLLTLGRWMGCFADFGWAWNIKPTRSEVGQWKATIPSAEFTESFVICLYGCTNVFLEHLGNWGGEWSAQDLEHISITFLFFGGGLCGMLIESKTIRNLLNSTVDDMPTRSDVHPIQAHELRSQPKNNVHPLNPLPALVILLLGIMMSSHQQQSMVSTMVHKQWGTLLGGFAFARIVSYIIMYISPPQSVYPTRPPTELVAAFCLISGGLIFMFSASDCIQVMEDNNLMAMFIFTVVTGFTAFAMAYEILVLSLKGWAIRREQKSIPVNTGF